MNHRCDGKKSEPNSTSDKVTSFTVAVHFLVPLRRFNQTEIILTSRTYLMNNQLSSSFDDSLN